jgi:hypothetical protein
MLAGVVLLLRLVTIIAVIYLSRDPATKEVHTPFLTIKRDSSKTHTGSRTSPAIRSRQHQAAKPRKAG